MILSLLKKFVDEVNATNSSVEKKEILSKYPELKEIIKKVYNPYQKFHVTSKTLKKHMSKNDNEVGKKFEDIFDLLNSLSQREITGKEALSSCALFVEHNKEYEELICRILDKDLKTRLGIKQINSIWPKLVPQFEVALAEDYSKFSDRVKWDENWYVSQKLDGIRCIAIKKNNEIKFFSRNGHEFHTLTKVSNSLSRVTEGKDNIVFDGELCLLDENGNESFSGIQKEFNRKDHTIENPMYIMFDMLTLEEFENMESQRKLSERLLTLKETISHSSKLRVLEQTVCNDEIFEKLQNKSAKEGWEGLMLRKDVPYKGDRTRELLKVKKFFDAEYKVLSLETGPFRVIVDGLEKEVETMTAVNIEHKGCQVSVGSGFSLDERYYYYENPSELVGKEITVKYFEETKNQQGGVSLRFPTVKTIHGNKRIA